MIRRIMVTGLGGIGGYGLCLMLEHYDFAPHGRLAIAFIVACGVLAVWAGEKLRIVPTEEQVNKESGPIRLFSADDKDDQRDLNP